MAAADDSDQLLHPIRPRVSDGRARVRRKMISHRMTDEVVLEARSSMCGSPMYGARGRHECTRVTASVPNLAILVASSCQPMTLHQICLLFRLD